MLELFVVGTFWFWALLIIFGILEIIFIECERVGLATFLLLATCCVLQFFGDVKVFSWIAANPSYTALCVGAYFGIGVFWSIIKWIFHTNAVRREYEEVNREFREDNDLTTEERIPEKLRREWESIVYHLKSRVDVKENKGRITMWIGYWPFSALWTLIDDPIKRFIHFLFDCLKEVYEKISQWSMRGIDDFKN